MRDFEYLDPEDERFMERLAEEYVPNDHYEIYISTNGDPFESIDVSSVFDTPEKLEELGFGSGQRTIIALTPTGLDILIQNGFSEMEIVREWGEFGSIEEDDY